MAQGTRGRWIRLTTTGLGVLLCTGLVGCWNTDKPKDTKTTPKQGLPGTTRLDAAGNPINTNPALRGTGSSLPPTGGLTSNPAAGLGSGQPQRYITDGRNTNTGNGVLPANYQDAPGFGGMPSGPAGGINAPVTPGIVQPPAPTGRSGSASQYPNNSAGGYATPQPPPPPLTDVPLPPAQPIAPGPGPGSSGFGGTAPIQPQPPAPIAPPATPPTGTPGKTTFGSVGGYPN